MSTQPTANDMYRAAQVLIRSGQPVFPCRTNGGKAKTPLTTRGLHDASLDLLTVKGWWKRHGAAAIGIPTGILWDVLDVDVKGEDGRRHLPMLAHNGLLNGCKKVVKTPSGGWHLYFKASPGLTNKASAALGLDVRSTGGYVLASPSFITTDDYEGSYTDMGNTTGSTDEPLNWDLIQSAISPLDSVSKKPIELLGYERQASVAALRGWLSERQSGERNNALHWAVCRCIDNGIDPHELVEVAVMIGLDEEETLLTISSAMRRSGASVEDLATEAEILFGKE